MSDTLTFDTIDRLQLLQCTTCGIAFAAPAAICLHRGSSAEPVYCPSAHANILPDVSKEPASVMANMLIQMQELANLRLQLDRHQSRQPLPAPASGPPSEEELKRRCRLLARTARQRSCPFCGKHSNKPINLFRHIWRNHKDRLAEALPIEH